MFSKFLAAAVAMAMLLIGFSTARAQDGAAAATQPVVEKTAFLGVVTSDVPDILRAQLNLPKGFGMVIDSVEPGSPAELAGLKKYDVLHKINDQIIVNREQLAVLIGSYKAGDAIPVTIIHQAQPATLTIKLAGKPVAAAQHSRMQGRLMQRPGFGRMGTNGLPDGRWMAFTRNSGLMRGQMAQRGMRTGAFGRGGPGEFGRFDRGGSSARGDAQQARGMFARGGGQRNRHDTHEPRTSNRRGAMAHRHGFNAHAMSDRGRGFGRHQRFNGRQAFDRRGESENRRGFNSRSRHDQRDGDREDDGVNARHADGRHNNRGFGQRQFGADGRSDEGHGQSFHSDARNGARNHGDSDREDGDRDGRERGGRQFDQRQGMRAEPSDDRRGNWSDGPSGRGSDRREMNSDSRNSHNEPEDDSNGGGRPRGMFRGGPMQGGNFNMRWRAQDGRRPGPSTQQAAP